MYRTRWGANRAVRRYIKIGRIRTKEAGDRTLYVIFHRNGRLTEWDPSDQHPSATEWGSRWKAVSKRGASGGFVPELNFKINIYETTIKQTHLGNWKAFETGEGETKRVYFDDSGIVRSAAVLPGGTPSIWTDIGIRTWLTIVGAGTTAAAGAILTKLHPDLSFLPF